MTQMETKIRFAPGDKVWAIRDCKAVEIEIHSISISSPKTLLLITWITYCGTYNDDKIANLDESECFTTKEELINYIIS